MRGAGRRVAGGIGLISFPPPQLSVLNAERGAHRVE